MPCESTAEEVSFEWSYRTIYPGGGGVLGLVFAEYVPLPVRAPTPLSSYLWPIIDPILVTFGEVCNFRDTSFSHSILMN